MTGPDKTPPGTPSEEARASTALLLYDVLRFAEQDGRIKGNADPLIEAARLLVAGKVTEAEERVIFDWLLDSDWRVTANLEVGGSGG